MALTEKRAEAERLYVREGLTCPRIAAELGVNEGTVYKWKQDAAARGSLRTGRFNGGYIGCRRGS
jgi:transposase